MKRPSISDLACFFIAMETSSSHLSSFHDTFRFAVQEEIPPQRLTEYFSLHAELGGIHVRKIINSEKKEINFVNIRLEELHGGILLGLH